jgi:glycosyltransferase involved in cell wall biosynthesis
MPDTSRFRQLGPVTYVTRSFLDYRIPVFHYMNEKLQGRFSVIYSKKWTPARVQTKLESILGKRAIGMVGEWQIGSDGREAFANASFCLPFQPGLYKALRATRPNVLIADGFFRWTPAAMVYKIRHRVPLMMCYERTFHTERNAQWVRTAYRKAVLPLFDAVCCNGRFSADYVRWLGLPPEHVTTGHNAADIEGLGRSAERLTEGEKDQLRRQLEIKGICFLFVGRLTSRKGVRELLEAWRQFRLKSRDEGTLVVLGDGPDGAKFKDLARRKAINNVVFVGAIDYSSIALYYAIADCFVMPTLEDNWSLVVPEAMSCGLPILCSIYNGCWPELVLPDDNGWVFDPLQRQSIVDTLRRAVQSRDRFEKMGRRSKEIVAQHSPEHAANAILSTCELAVSNWGGVRNAIDHAV